MKFAPLIALLILTACGAAGAPEAPEATPGVSISGEALIGVTNSGEVAN